MSQDTHATPKHTQIRQKAIVEHTGFYPFLQGYLKRLDVLGYAGQTHHRRENTLRRFIRWCDEHGLNHPSQITRPILERYQQHLHDYRQANGEPLSRSSQHHYLSNIKQFFKWLAREDHLPFNPASELELPVPRKRLPAVLSVEEVDTLMAQPNLDTASGLRDRAVLELLYSTGIRRTELCRLSLSDLSISQQTLLIRHGKGDKERLLPVGERALQHLTRYLSEARPRLQIELDNDTLILNNTGHAYRDTKLGDLVKRYLRQAGITATGSCHLLRHAMATHMLENGAELRYIQAMLGHEDYKTTQIYTHVSMRKLQQVHAATHPREQWRKEREAAITETGVPDIQSGDDDNA